MNCNSVKLQSLRGYPQHVYEAFRMHFTVRELKKSWEFKIHTKRSNYQSVTSSIQAKMVPCRLNLFLAGYVNIFMFNDCTKRTISKAHGFYGRHKISKITKTDNFS